MVNGTRNGCFQSAPPKVKVSLSSYLKLGSVRTRGQRRNEKGRKERANYTMTMEPEMIWMGSRELRTRGAVLVRCNRWGDIFFASQKIQAGGSILETFEEALWPLTGQWASSNQSHLVESPIQLPSNNALQLAGPEVPQDHRIPHPHVHTLQ